MNSFDILQSFWISFTPSIMGCSFFTFLSLVLFPSQTRIFGLTVEEVPVYIFWLLSYPILRLYMHVLLTQVPSLLSVSLKYARFRLDLLPTQLFPSFSDSSFDWLLLECFRWILKFKHKHPILTQVIFHLYNSRSHTNKQVLNLFHIQKFIQVISVGY